MTQQIDANQVLMGGAGAPALKFDQPGDRKVVTIVSPPQARQEREYDPNNPGGGAPKVFPSGDPIMGIFVEVREDATGEDHTLYVEGKRLKDAVKGAVRAAGARGLEVSGKLDITLTHYDEAGDRRSGRNWQIAYTPAGNAALMGDPQAQQQAPQDVQQAAHAQQAAQQAPAQQQAPAPAPQQPATPAGPPNAEQLAAFEAYQRSQQQQGS